jgi:hypothetical protein
MVHGSNVNSYGFFTDIYIYYFKADGTFEYFVQQNRRVLPKVLCLPGGLPEAGLFSQLQHRILNSVSL